MVPNALPSGTLPGWTGETIQAVFDSVPDAMLAVDRHGVIVMANVQSETLFGYEHRALIGKRVEVLIPERVQALHAAHRSDFFGAPRTRPMHTGVEFAGRRSDGTEIPVEISLSWIEADRSVLALAAIRDISARKRAEMERRELDELNRMKSELLHILSHEIFTPITTIQGTAITLLHSPSELGPDTIQELTTGVESAVARLRRLMRNLDVAARLEDEVVALSTPLVRVGDILEPAIAEFGGEVANGLIRSASPPEVLDQMIPADVELATRAIVIVIENALAFSIGQPVDIELADVNDEMLILISDRGPGIPVEMQERVFEPFGQVDSSTTRSHEGLGLGLFIARGIMRAHGGEIDARPREGGGTTFAVHAPMTVAIDERGRIPRFLQAK